MRLLLLLLIVSTNIAHAAQFKLGKLEGWKVTPVDKGSMRYKIYSGAEAVITLTSLKDGPSVLVHKLIGVPVPQTTLEWRNAVLLGKKLKPTQERLLSRGGKVRYFAEFEEQMAQEVTTKTVLMATEVDGEIYLLSYQSHLPIFQTEVREVLKLLNSIAITQ